MKFILGLFLATTIGAIIALSVGFILDIFLQYETTLSEDVILILVFFGIIVWLNSFDIKSHRNS